jgi:hypothetical protein
MRETAKAPLFGWWISLRALTTRPLNYPMHNDPMQLRSSRLLVHDSEHDLFILTLGIEEQVRK